MRSKEFRDQINAIKKATPRTPQQDIRDAPKTQGVGG